MVRAEALSYGAAHPPSSALPPHRWAWSAGAADPIWSGMTELSRPATLLRQADPDRFLTALFAPPARREALFTLYAFNNELARARDATREPMMAMIRLQWWREVVDGVAKAHEVATPLHQLLADGLLDPGELQAVIDAREQELDTIATLAEWQAWLLAGPGGLAVAAGRLLGRPGDDRLRALGAAYGLAGVLRNGVALARADRCLLPVDLLAEHGLSPEAFIAKPDDVSLAPMLGGLAAQGRQWLAAGSGRFGPAIAAALPGVLARRDLRQPGIARQRGLGDRAATMLAGMLGRV